MRALLIGFVLVVTGCTAAPLSGARESCPACGQSASSSQDPVVKDAWREPAYDACRNYADYRAYGSGLAFPIVFQREVNMCRERWERTGYVGGTRFMPYD